MKASQFFDDAVRDFRARMKTVLQPKAKKTLPEKPTHAIIFVAHSYPSWQGKVLQTLQHLRSPATGALPDNKDLSQMFGKDPLIKMHMKKVMPFVQEIKVRIIKIFDNRNFHLASVLQVISMFS